MKNNFCPSCGASATEVWSPFCSKRCADVDLGRWLTGTYCVPTMEALEEDNLPEWGANDE